MLIILHLSSHTDHITGDGTELTKRPYPFAVDADGNIQGRHDEVRAIGFQNDAAVQQLDLGWAEYVAGPPDIATRKYLITEDGTGRYATQVCAIERVEVWP